MNLLCLIDKAASVESDLTYKDFEDYCKASNTSVHDFSNQFAIFLAKGFHKGELSYEYCDEAINFLFGFMTQVILMNSSDNLPEPAFQIYQAFDSGEYYRSNDPTDVIPYEKYTRLQITKILSSL